MARQGRVLPQIFLASARLLGVGPRLQVSEASGLELSMPLNTGSVVVSVLETGKEVITLT